MSESKASRHCRRAPKAPRDKWRHTITSLEIYLINIKNINNYYKASKKHTVREKYY